MAPAKKRIFVVDDSIESITRLEAILTRAGYLVSAVFEAKDLFGRVFNEHPDLVLCDVCMPGLDGPTLTRLLKQTGRPVPVLLCSALPEHDLVQHVARCKAEGYVLKSHPPERILKVVQRILDQWQAPLCQT